MKRISAHAIFVAVLFAPHAGRAQAVAPATTPAGNPAKTETVVLSPFEVVTDRDTSYGALNSNSIAAVNMQLLKAPVAADIFTEQFMQDVAVTTVEDLLNGYGVGVGQV